MGEKLVVPTGSDIVIGVAVRDPSGTNYSPYTFANPSLAQVGIDSAAQRSRCSTTSTSSRAWSPATRRPGAPDYAGEWPRNLNWLQADGTTADLSVVPAAAKNLSAAIIKAFNGNGRLGVDACDLATSTAPPS